jgi:hypothetical protein
MDSIKQVGWAMRTPRGRIIVDSAQRSVRLVWFKWLNYASISGGLTSGYRKLDEGRGYSVVPIYEKQPAR